MRSPLSSIKMNTRLLRRETEEESVEAKHLELAEREIERMENMFIELLDYGKPVTLAKTKIEVENFAKSALDTVKGYAEQKGVTLKLDIGGTPVSIVADREQLLRALVNLLNNGIEACGDDGTVVLKVRSAEKDRIQFTVQDNGKGMSERVLSRIFDPFFTTRDEGVGLGMNNVKKIVEAHHGSVVLESEEGKGSTISMVLPIEDIHGDLTGHR
jgi:signal transduction histidine kinase